MDLQAAIRGFLARLRAEGLVREATMIVGGLSFDDIRTAVRELLVTEAKAAAKAAGKSEDDYEYCWISDIFPGFVVYEEGGAYYRRDYALLEGKVTLGTEKQVVVKAWVAVQQEALRIATETLVTEAAQEAERGQSGKQPTAAPAPSAYNAPADARLLTESSVSLSGLVLETEGGVPVLRNTVIVEAGVSNNGNKHVDATIQRDGPSVFEGAPVYATQHVAGEANVRNLAGRHQNVRWCQETKTLRGDLYGFASDNLLAKAAEAAAAGLNVGQSINTPASWNTVQESGRMVREVTRYFRSKQTSVDLVINPSAGGRLSECDDQGDLKVLEKIRLLNEATLATLNAVAIAYMCEGITEADIRAANPALADKILQKIQEAKPATPAANAITEAEQNGRGTTAVMTEADINARVDQRVTEAVRGVTCGVLLESTITARRKDLGDLGVEVLSAKFAGKVFETEAFETEVRRLVDLNGRSRPTQVSIPGGGSHERIQVIGEALDFAKGRLEAAITRKPVEVGGRRCQPFTRISQALIAFHPEVAASWINNEQQAAQECLQHFHWGRGTLDHVVQEATSVGTDTFVLSWADLLNRHLLASVEDPELNGWRQLVSEWVNFRDFSVSHKFYRVGELGEMPVVGERAPYQPLNKPTEEKREFSIEKRGALYSVSWEALLRDDIGVLARIPRDIARSWSYTVHDAVFGLLQEQSGVGPNMPDGKALYHADHGNIASLAFSAANLETVRRKHVLQRDRDSGRRKAGYRARFLAYATPELDQDIWTALESVFKVTASASEVNLPNYIRQVLKLEPVPCYYPEATTTRWETIANPQDAPTIGVGFLGGKETPDVLIADAETSPNRMATDEVVYKARGSVGATILDEFSFSRGNV